MIIHKTKYAIYNYFSGKSCPSFKIIILDEADSMTNAAQAALRRTMEKETKSTRFCLLCNYVSKIIEPLTSRCTKFRFKPLNDAIICEKYALHLLTIKQNKNVLCFRLEIICKAEKLQCDDKVLNILVEKCDGDMRRAITTLQSCFRLSGKKPIIMEDVYEVLGVIAQRQINSQLIMIIL